MMKGYGYDYWEHKGSGDHPQKFLATAMEALLGAYYLDLNESINLGFTAQFVRKTRGMAGHVKLSLKDILTPPHIL